MTRRLLMTAVAVAIALTVPLISIGTAEAHAGGSHAGGSHGGGIRAGGFRDRGFFGGPGFRGGGFRGEAFGFYYPRYYGNGGCYLTVYGMTYCY
jgi:hypothetical protein